MALTFGFYNSIGHDRRYNALQMSQLFDGIITDGVFMNIGTGMIVTAGSGLTVNVGIGRAWFNSTWTLNDAIYPIEATASDVLRDRIDAVVLEVDQRETARANRIFIKEGVASTTPAKPDMTKSNGVYQYPLCYITRAAGSTEITQANIENCVGTSQCPWVTGILKTVDTDKLVTQWVAQFDELYARLEDAVDQTLAGEIVDGSISTSKIIDGAVTEEKLDPDFVAIAKAGAPRNLLDNSDFRNPVNQRGVTTANNNSYFIDRWLTGGNGAAVSVTDDGVTIDATSSSSDIEIKQFLESLRDGPYTLVAYNRDGTIKAARVYRVTGTTVEKIWAVMDDCTIMLYYGNGKWNVTLAAKKGIKTSFEMCALYEGEFTIDNLPRYSPKGYSAELMECKRYYLHNVGQFLSGSFMSGSNSFRVTVPLAVPMRVNPTVTLVNGDSIIWAYGGQSRTTKVTGVTDTLVYPGGIVVNLTTEDNPGAYVPGHTFTTTLRLSADL